MASPAISLRSRPAQLPPSFEQLPNKGREGVSRRCIARRFPCRPVYRFRAPSADEHVTAVRHLRRLAAALRFVIRRHGDKVGSGDGKTRRQGEISGFVVDHPSTPDARVRWVALLRLRRLRYYGSRSGNRYKGWLVKV